MRNILIKSSLLLFVLLLACTGKKGTKGNNLEGTIKSEIKYAERFDILQKKGYSILTVKNPWQGAANISLKYFLIPYGVSIPAEADTASVIRVPLKKIIYTSSTHLSMISALKEEETITGLSGSDYVYEKKLRDLIEIKRIADVGYEDNLNKELVIQISPDVVMVYGVGSEAAGYTGKLKELGIKILFNADYLENDPLGKAEWIKVFGALYNKRREADSLFLSIAEEYEDLKEYIRERVKTRPKVFLGLPWKDTWFISPGNSYISRLITDAGGEYLWKETNSDVSMPLGIENVYVKALNAEFWLNTGNVSSRSEIAAIDNRLTGLPPFIAGNIYNNTNRVTAKGGNDYWEGGSIYPQKILKDIASILHPDLFPGYELFFYKKIR